MNKKNPIFTGVVVIQLVAIAVLIYFIKSTHQIRTANLYIIGLKMSNFLFKQGNTEKYKYFYEPKPLSKEEVFIPWMKKKAIYSINKDGLNSLHDYSYRKPKDTTRIMVMGDSYTFGQFVSTEKNWPTLLEKKISQKCTHAEVLNFGVPGYDIAYTVERFEKIGLQYKPDLIIWFMKKDDFVQSQEISIPLTEKIYEKYKDVLKGKNEEEKNRLILPELESLLKDQYPLPTIIYTQEETMRKFIDRITIPMRLFTPFEIPISISKSINKIISQHGNSGRWDDKKSPLQSNYKKYSFLPDDPHLNEAGHIQVAEDIYQYLINEKLVRCR